MLFCSQGAICNHPDPPNALLITRHIACFYTSTRLQRTRTHYTCQIQYCSAVSAQQSTHPNTPNLQPSTASQLLHNCSRLNHKHRERGQALAFETVSQLPATPQHTAAAMNSAGNADVGSLGCQQHSLVPAQHNKHSGQWTMVIHSFSDEQASGYPDCTQTPPLHHTNSAHTHTPTAPPPSYTSKRRTVTAP